MKLKWYLIKHNMQAKTLAEKCMLSPVYVRQIARGFYRPSIKTATIISQATDGECTVQEIRFPQDFADPVL